MRIKDKILILRSYLGKAGGYLKTLWHGLTKYLSKILQVSLILALLAVVVPAYLEISNSYEALNRRTISILVGHAYNQGLLNTILNSTSTNEHIFQNGFYTEIYKQNWDIFGALSATCTRNYFELAATLDSIDQTNSSIRQLYNQEGLIFAENQWNNTASREDQYYKELAVSSKKANNLFNEVSGCAFRYYTIPNAIIRLFLFSKGI